MSQTDGYEDEPSEPAKIEIIFGTDDGFTGKWTSFECIANEEGLDKIIECCELAKRTGGAESQMMTEDGFVPLRFLTHKGKAVYELAKRGAFKKKTDDDDGRLRPEDLL